MSIRFFAMLFESACLLAGPGRSTMFRTMEDVVGSIEWESLSEQTRKSYMTAWLRFKEFLPVDWKEATPEDVVAWVQTLAETVMTSTVETRIAGVSYFYRMFGNGNPCSSLKVKAALRVARRRIGKGSAKKRALSSEEIMAIIQHYSIKDPSGIRNAAIIAIGFSCALRRSEIVGLDLKDVMDRVGAHSLRAGFVTEAARNGASVAKIMDVTRHRTPYMVTEYIRDENKLENHAGAAFL